MGKEVAGTRLVSEQEECFLVGGGVTMFLFVLRQNYEVALLFFMIVSQSNLV